MNKNTLNAYSTLRSSQKQQIMRILGYSIAQGVHETGQEYAIRVLRQIENDGKIRELEEAIREFT